MYVLVNTMNTQGKIVTSPIGKTSLKIVRKSTKPKGLYTHKRRKIAQPQEY